MSAPELGPVAFGRWIWRQLTSMRTALLLLLLLAVAAVPGSFIPQRGVDARGVQAYQLEHPDLSRWLDRLGFFSVYTSPWFSAIYLLLMVSLVGCILPRLGVYFRALRARPPKAPRNFGRLPASGRFETEASLEEVMAAGRRAVGRARIDVVSEEDSAELRAEKGYLREAGNLVFHISIVAVLIGVAVGQLWSYRGSVIVTEGDGFSNALSQYDDFSSGGLFDVADLPPFSITLDDLRAEFQVDGPQRGAPRLFRATGEVRDAIGAKAEPYTIEVNHPLSIDGGSVFLVGQGYAPVIRVTDATGKVVFDDAVPFLPSDGTYTSTGVVKVPEAQPKQIGFQGFFLPSAYAPSEDEPSISIFPGPLNPRIGMNMWVGDLGLDDGVSQSVYLLNRTKMTQIQADGKPFRIELGPGEKQDLPGGGSIEFVELRQFARFQIARTPIAWLPLTAVSVGVFGLIASLAVRPRRTWIRARRTGSSTVVEAAALDRVPRDELPRDLEDFLTRLRAELGEKENS